MRNSGYRYGSSNTIKNIDCVRTAAVWAGGFGVFQSIIWMGLTIVGIIAYNCVFLPRGNLSFGTVNEYVFDNLYFRGSCGEPLYNLNVQNSLNAMTIFTPKDIFIWNCVYLATAFCWLISSGLLLIYIRKDNAKLTAGVMLTWVFITLCICLMDLALGITFGLDYHKFQKKSYDYNLQATLGTIQPDGAQILAAAITSIALMIISFKGFILWIINFVLMIYLLKLGVNIFTDDDDSNDSPFMLRRDSDDILTTRPPPIDAYQEKQTIVTAAYTNDAFVPETRSVNAISLNEEPLQRAARMSTDASLQDRRFRNLDAFQQYPPPRYNSINNPTNNNAKNRLGSTKEEEIIVTGSVTTTATGFPVPDYTPPMTRANQNPGLNGGIKRNQRY